MPPPIYASNKDGEDLRQGDVLRRTEALESLLREHYPRYGDNPRNKYFVVLTQCCDLQRRQGAKCSSRYIALAPVRPVEVALARKIHDLDLVLVADGCSVGVQQTKQRLADWYVRLLNNNEAEYYFLPLAPDRGIGEDCCAILALSIAIKSELHYQTCLDSRICTLTDSFRAKLGWAVGQMYSRIGTHDWEASEARQLADRVVENTAFWLDARQKKSLIAAVARKRAESPSIPIDKEVISELIRKLPSRKSQVVEQTIRVLMDKQLLTPAQEKKARNAIVNDPEISQLLG